MGPRQKPLPTFCIIGIKTHTCNNKMQLCADAGRSQQDLYIVLLYIHPVIEVYCTETRHHIHRSTGVHTKKAQEIFLKLFQISIISNFNYFKFQLFQILHESTYK